MKIIDNVVKCIIFVRDTFNLYPTRLCPYCHKGNRILRRKWIEDKHEIVVKCPMYGEVKITYELRDSWD